MASRLSHCGGLLLLLAIGYFVAIASASRHSLNIPTFQNGTGRQKLFLLYKALVPVEPQKCKQSNTNLYSVPKLFYSDHSYCPNGIDSLFDFSVTKNWGSLRATLFPNKMTLICHSDSESFMAK